MSRGLIFLFPGQSSRDEAMFARLDRCAPGAGDAAKARVEATTEKSFDGAFASNLDIQAAVFELNVAYLCLARAAGLEADASAGLSLGEYSHLVDIGALSDSEGRDLVAERGRCYDAGPDGAMAALHPIELMQAESLVHRVCEELDDADAVAISNINSPSQCVVAGRRDAVTRVLELADDIHCVLGSIIEPRIPMHVRRFMPVAAALRPRLERVRWRSPRRDYWPNVEARAIAAPAPDQIADHLARHVYERVQWRATIDALCANFGDPVFVEVGPRQVLSKMMGRRWIGAASVFSLDLMEDAGEAAFANTLKEISHAVAS